MVDSVKIETTVRENFGKGFARRMRREGLVPGVVYGHGGETAHIALPGHETALAIRGNANALLTVTVDGKDQLVLVKDVQRNPLTRFLEHVDLLAIKAGETVTVTIPVVTVGEPESGTVVTVETLQIDVTAPVTEIPESIEVDVEGKEEGTQIRMGDIELPKGVTTEVEDEELLVSVNFPIVDEELEAADAALAEEAAEEGERGEEGDSEESGDADGADGDADEADNE